MEANNFSPSLSLFIYIGNNGPVTIQLGSRKFEYRRKGRNTRGTLSHTLSLLLHHTAHTHTRTRTFAPTPTLQTGCLGP